MIFIEKELAFFDEVELLCQFAYRNHSPSVKRQLKPRNEFYQIWTPFYMESQLKQITNDEKMQTNTRKRKRKVNSMEESNEARNFLFSNSEIVQNAFNIFLNLYTNTTDLDRNNLRSNEIARLCVKMAPTFTPPISPDSECPLTTVQLCQVNGYLAESPCSSNALTISAEDNESADINVGAILCSNLQNCSLSYGQWIFPPNSSFLLGDFALSRYLLPKQFDLIVADPPWPNRTVKRQRTYQMFKGGKCTSDNFLGRLGDLPISQLLADDGLFCIWLSNSRTAHKTAQELLEKWKLRRLAQWHWLKVCKTGEPVCAFRPEHKVPFESLLIACKDCVTDRDRALPGDFCIISVPNANPSRKPPISLLLEQLGFIGPVRNGLELFARYLLPHFISVGFEATKFQHQYFFAC